MACTLNWCGRSVGSGRAPACAVCRRTSSAGSRTGGRRSGWCGRSRRTATGPSSSRRAGSACSWRAGPVVGNRLSTSARRRRSRAPPSGSGRRGCRASPRSGGALARVGDLVDLVALGVERARRPRSPVDLLVDVAAPHRHRVVRARARSRTSASCSFIGLMSARPSPHPRVRRVTEVDRDLDQRARAGRRAAGGIEVRASRRCRACSKLEPLVAAERAAGSSSLKMS